MTKQEEKNAVEILIFVSQMNLLSEQAEMIRGLYKYKAKHDLNVLVKHLDKMLKGFKETFTEDQIEMLNNMTDVFHEQSDSIRKQILEG